MPASQPLPDLLSLDPATSPERLRKIVELLASDELEGRAPGTEGSRLAREFIVEAFQEAGLEPAGEDGFLQRVRSGSGTNVIGLLEGKDPNLREEVVIVSAHYDHLGRQGERIYYGADDNASGVAILLETARAAEKARAHLRRSLLFIAFDAEEPPAFLSHEMGSRYFVEHPTVAHDAIALMIGMDLVGTDPWPGWEGRLFAMGSEKSPAVAPLVDRASDVDGLYVRRIGIHLIEEIPVWGRQPFSDYDAFRNREIPFLFLSCGRSADYHKPTDTAEKLNYDKMARIVRFLLSVSILAGWTEEEIRFEPAGEVYLQDAEMVHEGLEYACQIERPQETFPGYTRLAWTALGWWRPKVRRILEKLRAGDQIAPREVRLLERASIALQSLTTTLW